MWNYNYSDNSELYHYGVLGMKWGQHRAKRNFAKADRARRSGNLKSASKYENKAKAIEKKHTRLAGGKDTYNRVSKMSGGKALAQTFLYGSFGAMKYNQSRAKGNSRGRAFVSGFLNANVNTLTGGLYGIIEPRVN